MEKDELITVVVPIYNVEKYIRRCVDSVLKQTYHNLEIILVDDGSPDRCGEICDEYSKKDKRIKVIHKKNGGLSDARNAALDIMNGQYVTCIDSDDYVTKYYVENLYKSIKIADAEISMSWFENVIESEKTKNEGSIFCNDSLLILNKHDCLEKLLYQDGVETSAWGKLYKASIFEGLRYPKGKIYEDIPVTYRAISKANRIAVIRNVDYYYIQRKSSIQYQKFNHQKMSAMDHMKELVDFVDNNYPDLSNAARCRYFSIACNLLFQIQKSDAKKEKEFLWSSIKENRYFIIKDKKARKKAKFAALLSYAGYTIMREIYKVSQMRGN